MIICAVIYMIEYEVVKLMWRSSKKDLIPTFATFLLCLIIGVEYGILAGVGINLMFLLYPSARPQVNVEKCIVSNEDNRRKSVHEPKITSFLIQPADTFEEWL